jgi:selenium metabolism protein YedF
MRIVDTKGQPCPGPLIAARRALKEVAVAESFMVITDNQTSFDNLARFLKDNKTGFSVEVGDGEWTLTITKSAGEVSQTRAEDYCTTNVPHFSKGNFIVVFTSDKMGDGDDELGHLLIANFIKAIKDLDVLPGKIVFYNKGVTLGSNDSPVVDHLKELESMGIEMLFCATCVKYYSLEEKIGLGTLSNMFVIAQTMASAGNIVKP